MVAITALRRRPRSYARRCRMPSRPDRPTWSSTARYAHRPGGRRPAICSGKHRHGMNKVMAIPHRGHRDECPGRCPAQPTTWPPPRIWGILRELAASGLVVLVD